MQSTALVTTHRIAVLLRNEVLGRGVEAVLRSLPDVGEVHVCTGWPELLDVAGDGRPIDFLIVAAGEADEPGAPLEELVATGTRVLLLVDEQASLDASSYAGLPVDGLLGQRDLGAGTLRDALRRCTDGEFPMPPALARSLLAQAETPAARHRVRGVSLTAREMEALTLLVRGMSNKQIARRLAISSHGAKRLVASIMLKLDSPNRTTAAINAIKAGIVEC